jgi:DNA-binding NtrC family response regulator
VISARHLHLQPIMMPAPAPAAPAGPDLSGPLDELLERVRLDTERQAIAAALARHGNDTRRTADALGLAFRELVARMRQHGLGAD